LCRERDSSHNAVVDGPATVGICSRGYNIKDGGKRRSGDNFPVREEGGGEKGRLVFRGGGDCGLLVLTI